MPLDYWIIYHIVYTNDSNNVIPLWLCIIAIVVIALLILAMILLFRAINGPE